MSTDLGRALVWFRVQAEACADLAAACRVLARGGPWPVHPQTLAGLDRDAARWKALAEEIAAYLHADDDPGPAPDDRPLF